MAIGFSAFSQRLEIGDTTTTNSDWNVYIKSVVAETPVGKATGNGEVVDRATAKLTASLSSPGDSVTYTITVVNDGNIDAVLDVITLSTSNSDSVIKYSYSGIEEDEELLAQTEKSFIVTIEYDSTKTGNATTPQKQNTLTLDLDYVQKGNETIAPKVTYLNMKGIDVPLVTSGDGLYADTYENGRYVYRGAKPDNYIWFDLNGDTSKTDNETYRIMSVEADNTIKVVSQNSVGSWAWDADGERSDYCNSATCNSWGSNTTTLDSNENVVSSRVKSNLDSTLYALPSTEALLNTNLNTTFLNSIDTKIQNKIMAHTFNIGLLSRVSGQTLKEDISQEKTYKWKGKVALINVTDYVRASTNENCVSSYEYYNKQSCYSNGTTHNYLTPAQGDPAREWTLSPIPSTRTTAVWTIADSGALSSNGLGGGAAVHPSFYLVSDITFKGKGTEEEPFEIVF